MSAETSNRFSLPAGWTLERAENAATMIVPEGDLRVTFVEVEMRGTAQETALDAWRKIQPEFSSTAIQQYALPAEEGWDEMFQILYQVPASESRVEVAVVRKLGTRAFVNIITGTTAAMGRRGAQISEVLSGWKPEGLKQTLLNARGAQPWTEQHSRELKNFVVSAMPAVGVPGVSLAIVQHGRVIYAEGLGVRSLDTGVPVTAQTRFMIGSTTKPLTTLMMARMVEQKKLSWSMPVIEVLKNFELADPEITRRLELRHTASASTGMPRQDMEFIFKYSGITPEARLAEMKKMRPTTGFGETFQYSNFLVAAGGYAAAHAFAPDDSLEHAFEKAMAELVFRPLAMSDTFLRQEEALQGEAALPHATDFEGNTKPIPLQFEKAVYSVAPAGAAWSTAPDLANYLMLELGNGRLPGGEQIIAEEALLERRKKGIKIDDKSFYGLGLMISDDCGVQVIHHGGNTLGFTSDLFFFPESDLGFVVLTNLYAANFLLMAIRQKIFELIFGAEPKAEKIVQSALETTKNHLASLHKRVNTDAASVAWIEALLGTYRNEVLGSAQIKKNGESYLMQLDEWSTVLGSEIQPGGDRLLRFLSPPWRGNMKMLVTPDGQLVLDAAQQKYTFNKVA
jgi:CubicO group peptidase (beta-lactamase class C family)